MNSDATTSRLTVRLVLDHVRAQAGDAGVRSLLDRLGPEDAATVEEGRGPIPYGLKERLFDAAAAVLDDPAVGRRVGASVLGSALAVGLTPLVRAFATPEAVLKNVAKVATRFDTAAVMRCIEAEPGRAELAWRVLPPYRAFRADCDYNLGLLSQASVLFGLPQAAVTATSCQLDGDPECRYVVRWARPRRALGRRGRRRDDANVALEIANQELQLLQDAAADLVGERDVDTLIDRILDKVRVAVHAHAHALTVRLSDGTVHDRSVGAPDATGRELSAWLAEDPVAPRPGALVVEVASARRRYGAVAAVGLDGQEFFDADNRMLAAYARHLAAALDTAEAVNEARRQEETARLLLSLAQGLAGHGTVQAVADAVAAAAPALCGSDWGALTLWDDAVGELTVAGAYGFPEHLRDRISHFFATGGDAPELAETLVTLQPRLLDSGASEWARNHLADFGSRALVALPVTSADRLIGLIVAHWTDSEPPSALDSVLIERLTGLARQAATALENVRLLEQVRHQAQHDPLTGLPNRLLLEERLAVALADARRSGRLVAVLFCDLNRFKRINDSLGHAAGDELLREVADRLRTSLRATDVAARFSGDEFVVLLPDLDDEEEAAALAARLTTALGAPFDIHGTQVFADSAVGVAVGDGGTPADALLARADQDMYVAKTRLHGPGAVPSRRDPESLALEADLHGAAERGELLLHYQPQFDLSAERVVGVEALVRWRHPVRGLVPPGAFIPLAEESGLIAEIGDWVLREACGVVAGWRARGMDLAVSVNVAAPQLHHPCFADRIRSVLSSSGLAPSALTLEITESQVVADPMATGRQLQQLRDLGVGVSVDDFGTGYSSLSQLRRLPVTEVKIDRSFVAELDGTDGSAQFLEGLVGLARGLRLTVVAEGVETSEQLEVLGRAGCDLAQGFLLSRPLEEAALLEFLELGMVGAGL